MTKVARPIIERNAAIHELATRFSESKPDANRLANAVAVLNHSFSIPSEHLADPIEFWIAMRSSQHKFAVRNAHRQYRQAITWAYAIYEVIMNSGEMLERHLQYLYADQPVGETPDILLATVRAVIEYDEGWRGAASRDAQAIRYLQYHNFGPHEIEDFYQEHGGGVDEWSRLYSGLQKRASTEATSWDDSSGDDAKICPEATRQQATFKAKKAAGSVNYRDHTLSIDLAAVQDDQMWAFFIERRGGNFIVIENGYVGVSSHPHNQETIELLLKIGNRLLGGRTD